MPGNVAFQHLTLVTVNINNDPDSRHDSVVVNRRAFGAPAVGVLERGDTFEAAHGSTQESDVVKQMWQSAMTEQYQIF